MRARAWESFLSVTTRLLLALSDAFRMLTGSGDRMVTTG
jgi:hypothetical protein